MSENKCPVNVEEGTIFNNRLWGTDDESTIFNGVRLENSISINNTALEHHT